MLWSPQGGRVNPTVEYLGGDHYQGSFFSCFDLLTGSVACWQACILSCCLLAGQCALWAVLLPARELTPWVGCFMLHLLSPPKPLLHMSSTSAESFDNWCLTPGECHWGPLSSSPGSFVSQPLPDATMLEQVTPLQTSWLLGEPWGRYSE